MRVLLWDLPVWLEDILRDAIREDKRLELVERYREGDMETMLAAAHVDVLVTHAGGSAIERSAQLLFAHPRLRMVSLGSGRANSAQLSLNPSSEPLGDVSLSALLAIIAGDQPATATTMAFTGSR